MDSSPELISLSSESSNVVGDAWKCELELARSVIRGFFSEILGACEMSF